ncbi:MAG: lysine--tRNA ligase, partial [Arsenophonus sp. ER-LPS3-MAG3]
MRNKKMSRQQNINRSIDLRGELKIRREKLEYLRCDGIAFPNDFRREYFSSDLHLKYENMDIKDLTKLNINVSVAGRMLTQRIMGKVSFA